MMDELVLAVDSSTTAAKAIVFDERGQARAEGRAAIRLDNPVPDGWQQDAEAWWAAFATAASQATAALGAGVERLRAVCITHQRETFVVTDEAGQPLHPALVWMDARCRPQVARAVEQLGAKRLHELSGKPACTTPSLYKLMFLLESAPHLAARRPRVLDVHAFLVWRLTGRCATSLASADPLGMVDMHRADWAPELLELAGVDRCQLPELVPPGAQLGTVGAAAATACGLPAGLPVIAGAGDGQCAGLGAGIATPGEAYLNLGTAVVSGVLSRTYQCDPAFRTLYGGLPDAYFLETDLQGGTFTVTWLVDRWLRGTSQEARKPPSFDAVLADLETGARKLSAGADGLVLVPYWNGVMNPYWDDDATGVLLGLTGTHGPAHVYRAILEGIALEQRLHTRGVEQAVGPIEQFVVLGGGSRSDLWCQILADVLGRPMVRVATEEATALGAGMLAAAAVGLHEDLDAAVAGMTSTGRRFEPGSLRAQYDRLYDEVYDGLFATLRDRLGRLAKLRRDLAQ